MGKHLRWGEGPAFTGWNAGQCVALCSGYINFTSVYIAWLCGAIFLHLPSFASLGIDFKTDLSLLLTVFLFSLLVGHLAGGSMRKVMHASIGLEQCLISGRADAGRL